MKAKWIGSAFLATAIFVAVGGYVVKPAAETYISPMVKEQLNNAVNGRVEYDGLSLDWTGAVLVQGVKVYDGKDELFLEAPSIEVSTGLWELGKFALNGSDGLALISKVTLYDPHVYLREYTDASWNVSHIKKEKAGDEPTAFRGHVVVNKGTVDAWLANQRHLTLRELDGALKYGDYPSISGALSAVFDKEVIRISGEYQTETADFSAFMETNMVKDQSLRELLGKELGITIEKGYIQNSSLTVKRQKGRISIDGKASLGDVEAFNSQYRITKGTAQLSFSGDKVTIERAEANVNEQNVVIVGTISDINEDMDLNLHATAPSLRIDAFYPDFAGEGTVDVDAYVTGTLKSPKAEGFVTTKDYFYGGERISKGRINYRYENDLLSVLSGDIRAGGGNAIGHGWYNLANADFSASIEGSEFPLAFIGQAIGREIKGQASFTADIKGEKGRLAEGRIKALGKDISYGADFVDEVEIIAFAEKEKGFTVPYGRVRIGEGTVLASGTFTEDKLSFDVTAESVELSDWLIDSRVKAEGKLDASGTIVGSISNPRIDMVIGVGRGKLNALPFTSLSGKISLENQTLNISRGYWEDTAGGHSISGNIDTTDSGALDLTVETKNVRLENIMRPLGYDLTGWLHNKLYVKGTLDNPQVRGEAQMWDGSAYGELISAAEAGYRYENDTLYIEQSKINAYNSEISASGTVAGTVLNVQFEGKNIDLERVIRDTGQQINGYANIIGKIEGTTERPVLTGQMTVPHMSINDTTVSDISGQIYIDPTVINLQNATFTQEQGQFELQGGMTLQNKGLFGYAKAKNGNINSLLRIVKMPLPNLNGNLEGVLNLGGTLTTPDIEVKGTIKDVAVGKELLGDATIDAKLSKGKLDITTLRVPVKSGLLAIQGDVELEGKINLTAAAMSVPVELILPLTGKEIPFTGNLDFLANVSGTVKNPEAEASITLANGSYNEVGFDHFYGLLYLKDGALRIHQALLAKGPYKATAYGRIPLIALYSKALPPKEGESTMDVDIKLDATDLGLVSMLVPGVTQSLGNMEGKVKLKGTYDKPLLEGNVFVQDGTIGFKGVGNPLTRIQGNLQFLGDVAKVSMTGGMGKGSFALGGEAAWRSGNLDSYRVALEADKLEMKHNYYKGPITGRLELVKKDEHPSLSGRIDIADTSFDIPLSFESGGETTPLLLDVTVAMGKNARLYNKLLYNVLVTGEAHFRGSTESPRIDGGYTIESGALKYLNTQFKLMEGRVSFSTLNSFLPTLMLKGHTTLRQYRIFMELSGPADKLDLTLQSEPHLEKSQIVSLLTLKNGGRHSSEVNSEDVNALITAGLEMTLFSNIESTLQGVLGLDWISLTTGSLDPYEPTNKVNQSYYNIEIGKYVLPNFMLMLSMGVNNDQALYGTRYDINSRLSLNGWINNRNRSYIGGQWRFTF